MLLASGSACQGLKESAKVSGAAVRTIPLCIAPKGLRLRDSDIARGANKLELGLHKVAGRAGKGLKEFGRVQ